MRSSSTTLLFSLFPRIPCHVHHFYRLSSSSSPPSSLPIPASNNPFVFNYLISTFGLSETKALASIKRLPRVQTADRPESAVHLLREYGFSDAHVRKTVQNLPQILFADVDRILKPKLKFFQDLGLSGPDLGLFISKNPTLLSLSLDGKLAPCVGILRKFLSGEDLIRTIHRCKWVISKDPNARLRPNIDFLRNHCGIDGSQLLMLLKRQPRVFVMRESALRDLVQNITEMGFPMDSRMFVYVLYSFTSLSPRMLHMKLELFYGYGFSKEELMVLLKRAPNLIRTSEEKLRSGLDLFVNRVGVHISGIIAHPACLMYSMEKRVAPRYRVLQILDSKKLLKKDTKLLSVIQITEEEFLKRFILRFADEAGELLGAYNS